MCLLFSTYFIILLQEGFIHCMINNGVVIFLYVKFLYVFKILPVVPSRPTFIILKTKVSQDIGCVRWIPGDMDDTCGFGSILRMIYISFSEIASAIIHLGVIILQGRFSSHFPSITRTDGTFPCIIFIRRLYYTFVNIFWNFCVLKNVNICFKSNIFIIKSLYILLLDPDIGHTFWEFFI